MAHPSVCFPQGPGARTPGRSRAPHGGLQERQKENIAQVNVSPLCGGLRTTASPQRTISIHSVASTYSEFAVIWMFNFSTLILHVLL